MKEGLDVGDRAVQIIAADRRAEQIRRLTETDVDSLAAEQRSQLVVWSWEDSVLRGGRFDQHAMIAALQEFGADGEQRSGITRIWANMGWAVGDFPGAHDIVEYESRLNYVLPKYDIAAVCTYDPIRRFCHNGHLADTPASYRREGLAGKSILRSPR